MVHSTNKPTRSLAALALPGRIHALIAYATAVVDGMTGNPLFPTPTLPLATVSAAIEELKDAQAATMTRAKGTVAARDAGRHAVVTMLHLLRIYVQSVADRNAERAPAVIRSAGMAVYNTAGRRPRVFAAFAGAVPGTVKVVAPGAGNRAFYDWQVSIDGAAWLDLPSTMQATTTLTHPSPGTPLHVRYRVVTAKGPADWSAPITFTVS